MIVNTTPSPEASCPESIALRDRLALDRTRLANERTLLAYVRTAFMLVVAGATALKLFVDTPVVIIAAWAMIGLGVVVLFVGGWRFAAMRRQINSRGNAIDFDSKSHIHHPDSPT
jgi:putative membrane protein